MSKTRSWALAGGALIVIFVQLPLAWLHQAERDATLESLNQPGGNAYILWREMQTEGEAGPVVQHLNMDRSTVERVVASMPDVLKWGLLKHRVEHGYIGEKRHVLRLLELEQSLDFLFGGRSCANNEIRPLGNFAPVESYFTGQEETLQFGMSARAHPISLLNREFFSAEVVRCVRRLEVGAYLIVLLDKSPLEAAIADRINAFSGQLFSGMSERIQVRNLEQMLLEQQHVRASWLRIIRWTMAILALAGIVGLLLLDTIIQRTATTIRHVLGALPFRHARDGALRVAKWLLPAAVLGWLGVSAVFGVEMTGSGVVVNTLWIVGFSLIFSAIVSFITAHRLHRDVSSRALLNGNWSSAGGGILLGFWSSLIVVLTVVASLTVSMHARLVEFSGIDWGYDTQNLFSTALVVPNKLLESPLYRDRLFELLEAAERRPEVVSATVLAPAPWRFKGLERVRGTFVQGFGVGPDFVETLRPDAYFGRDFERGDMIDAAVVAFQNRPDNEALRRHFGRQIGTLNGFRWDPLSAVTPAVSLTPITREPQAELELVWRIQPGTDRLPSKWIDEFSQAFPEAIFATPERVSDVIDRRFETLGRFAMLGGVLMLSTLILALLLTTLVLAQILSQEHRALAIRMALGAGPWRALQHWGGRFGAAMMFGLAAGVWASWSLNGILSAYIFGYRPAPLVAMLVVAGLLLLIVALALLLAARNISRVNLQAALSE